MVKLGGRLWTGNEKNGQEPCVYIRAPQEEPYYLPHPLQTLRRQLSSGTELPCEFFFLYLFYFMCMEELHVCAPCMCLLDLQELGLQVIVSHCWALRIKNRSSPRITSALNHQPQALILYFSHSITVRNSWCLTYPSHSG